jgi:hypothetical protein
MRRTYLWVLLSVVLPVVAAYAQPAHGGGRGQSSGHAVRGRAGGSSFSHGAAPRFVGGRQFGYRGRGYGYGGFYRRGPHVIVYGYGYGYGGWGVPYYTYYYGSDYYGDYDSQPYSVYPAPADGPPDQVSPSVYYENQDAQGYYQVGNQWGIELKQYQVTMDQLVTYLRAYIINSSPAQQSAFRSGFIASALPDATVMFDQAMQQAASRG